MPPDIPTTVGIWLTTMNPEEIAQAVRSELARQAKSYCHHDGHYRERAKCGECKTKAIVRHIDSENWKPAQPMLMDV